MVNGIWLILLGVLAVPSMIIAKKPNAKELIAKITPYQGWIGAVSALWGVWGIIGAILAVPLLVIVKIILANIPETKPIATLISNR